jgi:membrane protease YdiL (CAAX protease family)
VDAAMSEPPGTHEHGPGEQPAGRGQDRSGAHGPAPSGVRGWSPWFGPAALVAGLVAAAVGGLVIDIPAAVLGVKISESHIPPGLVIADTVVQDVAFVAAAVFFAQLGGRRVGAWQFGLRPPRPRRTLRVVGIFVLAFVAFLLVWSALVHTQKEKLLETLGTHESTALLLLSAALTCVIAPICEEFLFRGFIFSALRNWRGIWPAAAITGVLFGGVHALGSAPASDLPPLVVLGFLLCLVYQYTGSLYPCVALHALNNSIAFAGLEEWSAGDGLALLAAAWGAIALIALTLKRTGVIAPAPREPAPAGSAYAGG